MTERDRDLARFLVLYADAAEAGGVRDFGFMREAARRLLELSEGTEDGCEHCGARIGGKQTGRPARFCSSRCRVAAHRETKAVG